MQGFSVSSLVRRRWTVIVAVIVVAVVAFTVYRLHGIFGSNNEVSRPSADSLENTGYNPKRVLFEVFGSPGLGGHDQLPGRARPTSARRRRDSAVVAHVDHRRPDALRRPACAGDGDSIGCRITVNGVVKDERSTSNVNGYIACLDKSA